MPDRSWPVRGYLDALLVAVVLALFARTWVVQAFAVPSESMLPTLMVGDHILVNKFVFQQTAATLLPAREVRRGDLVLFRHPHEAAEVVIKRCPTIAGDRLRLVDKRLLVDDVPVAEPQVVHIDPHVYPRSQFLSSELRNRDNFGPLQVPDGHIFCLGDNRDVSRDSRVWGPVPTRAAIGRAVLVAWSFEDHQPSAARGSPLERSRLGRGLALASSLARRLRLERTLRPIR